MRCARLREEDGLIRGALWLFLIVALVAIVLLDGISVFHANQSVRSDASVAADEARNAYAQSPDYLAAKAAAQAYLARAGDTFVAFSTSRDLGGDLVFTVTAKAHANTYAMQYLRYVGLRKWVRKMTNPEATETSD